MGWDHQPMVFQDLDLDSNFTTDSARSPASV